MANVYYKNSKRSSKESVFYRTICYRHPETGKPTIPLPEQKRFHECKAKYALYAGAFRAGKTAALVIDGLTKAFQYPGTKIVFSRKTSPELRISTRQTFFETLGCSPSDAHQHPLIKRWNMNENEMLLTNGTKIYFLSIDQTDKIKSTTIGAWYMDETTEFTEEDFLFVAGRLSDPKGPRIMRGATNPEGHDWVWRMFHPESKDRIQDAEFFHSNAYDNHYLPPDYTTALEKFYPEHMIKRYLEGSFDVFEGMVYPEFNPEKHVVKFNETAPYTDCFKFCLFDHGYRNPTAAYKCHMNPNGIWFIYGEHYKSGWSPAQHAAVLKPYHDQGYPMFKCDPSCRNKTSFTENKEEPLSIISLYRRLGVFLDPAPNELKAGIWRVKDMMMNDRIVIHPSCTNFLEEIRGYKWKKLKPNEEGYKPDPEVPVKMNDHAMDCMRYGANFLHLTGYKKYSMTEFERRNLIRMKKYCIENGIKAQIAPEVMDRYKKATAHVYKKPAWY